ncbi:sugar phosphorylase [Petroclostridium xylanilyticum]|uniref:sugar phosphorylase n=1 Tax=Petroclostridium xylanilyticum TaxID=1792311 RepID=UPI000B990483|nr:sugar phosphorylase [Petroclostridium xylanilyticum]
MSITGFEEKIYHKLQLLYGTEEAQEFYCKLIEVINRYKNKQQQDKIKRFHKELWLDERDVFLITYGDQVKEQGVPPLKTLEHFLNKYFKGVISFVHILPFYPYTSDDGFSVSDYAKVNPEFGEWEHIEEISKQFNLMFDAVINHISSKSEWFCRYLEGDKDFDNFFIEMDKNTDVSKVTRPRTLPLLTKFSKNGEEKYLWTTFSEDQIDLNYKNGNVLIEIIDILLFYASKGAKVIRLDAIGYLWKEIGTSCIHLPQTHTVIQLFRDIFDIVYPEVILITETNVPHKDNITYFGNGYNEAQMVYQFSLAPLVLNAFHTGSAIHLIEWASSLEPLTERTTFFNFLASHDGIGVVPAKGILTDDEIDDLTKKVTQNGGYVSYKTNSDETQSPYELNITYFDALSDHDDAEDVKIKRFITAHSILLSMVGVPAVYIHSIMGSQNYYEGVKETGRYRSINRQKFNRKDIEQELMDSQSIRFKVYTQLSELIKKRKQQKAFHPNGKQQVLNIDQSVFSLLRTSPDGKESIISLNNVSGSQKDVRININDYLLTDVNEVVDVISGTSFKLDAQKGINILLEPYQVMWLKV